MIPTAITSKSTALACRKRSGSNSQSVLTTKVNACTNKSGRRRNWPTKPSGSFKRRWRACANADSPTETKLEMIYHEGPSAAEPQPKLGVSPAKTERAQSSEIEGENHL